VTSVAEAAPRQEAQPPPNDNDNDNDRLTSDTRRPINHKRPHHRMTHSQ